MAGSSRGEASGLTELLDALTQRARERPYAVLGLGLATGYVAGGGLFSTWTRPLARAALGALLVPGFRDRVREITREFRSAAAGGQA